MPLRADEKLISRLQFAGSIGMVIALVAFLGFYFIHQQQIEFEQDSLALLDREIANSEALLTERVSSAEDYLEYMRRRTETVLKTKVREETNQVMAIAETIYQRELGRRSIAEIKRMIVETIRPMRYNDGHAYFFIHQLDGVIVLLPTNPELEGTNQSSMSDDNGVRLQPRIFQAALSPDDQGFLWYRWRPLENSGFADKLGYIRLFKPFGWAIGSAEYYGMAESSLKQEAIERLRSSEFTTGADLMVIDDSGRLVVLGANSEWEGKSFVDLPPARAKTIEEILQLGRKGGGVLRHEWNRALGGAALPKLSFVSRMDNWGWTLVSGVYLDDLERVVQAGRGTLEQSVREKTRLTVFVLALGLGMSLLIGWGVSALLKQLVARYKHSLEMRNAELKEANRRLFLVNFMVDNSDDMILLVDCDCRIVYANHDALERLGLSKEQKVDGPMLEAVSPRGSEEEEGEDYRRYEVAIPGRDGVPLPLEVGVKDLVYDGNPYRFAIARDITERRRWETDLRRSNAELEAFAYVASHDLRQPLRAVSSFLSLLERRLGRRIDRESAEFLNFAREGARRMDRLILDLLAYSRVGRVGAMDVVDLDRVMTVLLTMLALAADESDGKVHVRDPMPKVWGNEDELTRLFQNLIGNALKYRSPERLLAVEIACADDGNDWLFTVSDNGIGIEPGNLERIFGLFQRLHAPDKFEGTGIGLAVSRKIVESHGGRIWAESTPGEGTRFIFTLPKNGQILRAHDIVPA